jgi:hypothetical protein
LAPSVLVLSGLLKRTNIKAEFIHNFWIFSDTKQMISEVQIIIKELLLPMKNLLPTRSFRLKTHKDPEQGDSNKFDHLELQNLDVESRKLPPGLDYGRAMGRAIMRRSSI